MAGYTKVSSDYGQGDYDMSPEELDAADPAAALTRQVIACFASASYKPPLLPEAALEVHRLAQDEEVDLRKLVLLLRKDSVLAAQVLRRAQSPLYAPVSGVVTTLQDAVARLGLKPLRDLVWETALAGRVFRSKRYASLMADVQRHCTATAYFARLVAMHTAVASELAFIAGLMHDIGIAATLIVASEMITPPPDPTVLAGVVSHKHEEVSALVARLWQLPVDLQTVLAHHHAVLVDRIPHPVAAVVAVAEQFATRFNAGLPLLDRDTSDERKRVALQALRLEGRLWRSLEEQAAALAKGLQLITS